METTVGVLCGRVRVEEKRLLAALAEAGFAPSPVVPDLAPLPIPAPAPSPSKLPSPARTASTQASSSSPRPAANGHEATRGVASTNGRAAAEAPGPRFATLIDRHQDRATASVLLRAYRALGIRTVDAGLAATGDRLAVAAALAGAGLPRPETRLVVSEAAALAAVAAFGYPTSLAPLDPAAAPVALLDVDTAEAVLEHRAVLGAPRDLPALVQAGAPTAVSRLCVIVVDGQAAAVCGGDPSTVAEAIGQSAPATGANAGGRPTSTASEVAGEPREADGRATIRLAEMAALAVGAGLCGVDLLRTEDGWVVWDVQAVPDFRDATPLVAGGVEGALARLLTGTANDRPDEASEEVVTLVGGDWSRAERREVRDGVALFA